MGGNYVVQTSNAAGDAEAVVLTGTGNVARDEGVAVGGSGNAAAKDSGIAQSAGNNSTLNTGISGNQNSTVTLGYDAGQFQTALQTVGNNTASALNNQSATIKETLTTALGQLSSLAESKQTDGVSGLSKTALWALGITALAIVTWLLNRK